jgi:hypothetical protein
MRSWALYCPKACGAFFDGGSTKTFRPLATHIAANKCRSRRQTGFNKARELDGPYLPTTMGDIHVTMEDIATRAATQTNPVATYIPFVNFCLLNPAFIVEHLRMSGAQFAASLPNPTKTLVTATITSLFCKAVPMRVEEIRTITWAMVFLFPSLFLGPQRPGAPSSAVKEETKARLNLWHRGDLLELARRAVAARLLRPTNAISKKEKAARRAIALLTHNMFARAPRLADNT